MEEITQEQEGQAKVFLGKITYGDLVGMVSRTSNGRKIIACGSVLDDALT